jgi:hypothetical protein
MFLGAVTMRRISYRIALLPLILLVLFSSGNRASGYAREGAAQTNATAGVTVRAGSGSTIEFWTQNGETIDNVAPRRLEVPHLVLFRNGELADASERTLVVEVNGIEVPPGGVTLTLKLETQHGDPDLGGGAENRIPVWSESQWTANSTGMTQTGVSAVFVHEFDGTETLRTPTDYYRYEVSTVDSRQPTGGESPRFVQESAFLLENQWTAPLPALRETSARAAPDELVVYYCDMFPIQEAEEGPAWLPRESVPDYVRSELVPALVEAFRVQTEDWGFGWHDAWTSYRAGAGER